MSWSREGQWIAYLQNGERGGLDDDRRLAAKLNEAGESCRKAGLTLACHGHAFEHEAISGVRPFDILMAETQPAPLDCLRTSHARIRRLTAQAGVPGLPRSGRPTLASARGVAGAEVRLDDGRITRKEVVYTRKGGRQPCVRSAPSHPEDERDGAGGSCRPGTSQRTPTPSRRVA